MNWIAIGALSFVLFTVFDLNKLKRIHPLLNGLFGLGVLLLLISAWGLLENAWDFGRMEPIPVFVVVSTIGALEMIYALFFALSFKETYVETGSGRLVDTGLYALCRHPGVWGFALLAFGIGFSLGSPLVLIAALVWTLLDILHVVMQDRYFFPATIQGYDAYQKRTPFLFFGLRELRACIDSFQGEAQ